MAVWWWQIIACGLGGPPSPERCAAMGSGSRRDACYVEIAVEMFRADPFSASAQIEADVADSQVRDFIWLTVTRELAPNSMRFCARIEAPAIAERCRVLVHRPHLHRALQKARSSGE